MDENFISLKEASKMSPYSSDYLSLLVRKGRLYGIKKDGKWMTTQSALGEYIQGVAEASFVHQENLNVKNPAVEKKEALINLRWAVLLAALILGIFIFWRIDGGEKQDLQYFIEKDEKNNLFIHVDNPEEIRSVTIVPNDK